MRGLAVRTSVDIGDMCRSMYERMDEARVVPFTRREPVGWTFKSGECYANVDGWVRDNSTSIAVRGWLVFDWPLLSIVRFTPHSVIEEADGRLIDITPSQASRRYPFLRHDEGSEAFDKLVGGRLIVHLDFAPATGRVTEHHLR